MTEAILHATKGNPVPENHIAGFFNGHKNKKLRYAIFRSSRSVARGTIVLLHGRNECIEKYFETINDLTAKGFWVATFDTRGQGGSERMLKKVHAGYVRRFSDYQKDISLFLEQVVLPDTRLPFFMIAHSTGGLAALSMAPMLANRIERMVLSSPFISLSGQSLPAPWIRTIATLFTLIGLGGMQLGKDQRERQFEGNPLTSDPVRFARNASIGLEHPELFVGAPTARWLFEVLKTMPWVKRQDHLTKVIVPTLILAPMLDTISRYAALEELSRNFRAAQLIPVTGARHELFLERDVYRSQAMAAIDAFFAPET
ncbi:alpha/beta hydrolase [Rhizobium sp. Leaf262]|uniref:alpha/beta fold hydrolase n=1 Tax=Rhizobium sp. Leaf262 TaxID=1736312 RepID=UPI0007155B68|nr:alpha/beta hydrolase [Rhizobium sp. Leaf262]KQO75711.1 lysophospholipase [Rhizobium sp. Leaf262]